MNLHLYKKILCLLLSFTAFHVWAEDFRTSDGADQSTSKLKQSITNNTPKFCGFENSMKEMEKNNPGAYTEKMLFEDDLQHYISGRKESLQKNFARGAASLSSYIIPVVFHIYGDDFVRGNKERTPTIVDQQRIRDALALVNKNFVTSNNSTDPFFSTIEGDIDVEFKLAQIDPDGNTTTGIIYHEYQEGFALNSGKDSEIAKYAWDNYKYFNIHIQIVLKNGGRNNSGTAWPPRVFMNDAGTARVVYNGKYLLYDPPASSLTHEFGHWFGLDHTFSGGGCVADPERGDQVADTPPTEGGLGCGFQANCLGEPVNSENHMDYNPCETMFTQGQIERMDGFMQHPARINLWKNDNLISTGIKNNLGPRIIFNYQEFADSETDKYLTWIEHFDNDGSILNKRKIKAVDGAIFSQSNGLFVEGVDFTTSGVPAGLTMKINLLDNTTAELSFEGTASEHERVNNASISITLLDHAISGDISSLFSTTGTFELNFIDPYGLQYGNLDKQYYVSWSTDNNGTINTEFESLLIGGKLSLTPTNFDGDTVTFNNFLDRTEFLTETGTKNIRHLAEGEDISASADGDWHVRNAIEEYPSIITSPDYTVWNGKIGYAGMRIATINNSYLYGWVKVNVNSDGTTANVIGWGINELSGTAISSGINNVAVMSYQEDRFVESNHNDGSFTETLNISLDNTTFSSEGTLLAGTHFNVTGLPEGLQLEINATSSTKAIVSISGNSDKQGWNFQNNTKVVFLDAAFNSSKAEDVVGSSKAILFEYIDDSFSRRLTDKVAIVGKEETQFPSFIRRSSIDNDAVFQTQFYTDQRSGNVDGFKLITWRKDALANADYEVIPLDFGAEIGPNSPWQPGREYWSFRGQHMIDSNTSEYHEWRGQTKYIGVRFRRSGKMHYGWIKASLDQSGNKFEFLEFGLSGKYDTGIKAGTLEAISTTLSTPVAATLISPSGVISDTTPTYTWNAVSNAPLYYLRVRDSTGRKIEQWYSASEVGCGSGSGTCSITPSTTLSSGNGYWTIKTKNDVGFGPWSTKKTFTISEVSSQPETPILISPNGAISDNTPTFTWTEVPGTIRYAVVVRDSNGAYLVNTSTRSNTLCPDGVCSYIKNNTIFPDGEYSWNVRVINPDNSNGVTSQSFNFSIKSQNDPDNQIIDACLKGQTPVGNVELFAENAVCLQDVANEHQIQMRLHVPAEKVGSTLEIILSHGVGNGDLLHKYDGRPRRTTYDHISNTSGNEERILVHNVQPQWNYIHVRANEKFSGVTLLVRYIK